MNKSTKLAAILGCLAIGHVALAGSTDRAAFTYQGSLYKSGQPVNERAEMIFKLFDAETGGSQVGLNAFLGSSAAHIEDGLFTVTLDFGPSAFADDRWLEIIVRTPVGVGDYTTLPRQRITTAPYASQVRGLHVTSSDFLGVGTNLPIAKLHVFGGDIVADRGDVSSGLTRKLDLVGARNAAGNDFATINFNNYDSGDQQEYSAAQIASRSNGTDGAELHFSTSESGSLTQRMTIASNGNVGVGVADPTTPIAIQGNGATASVGITQNQVGGASTMEFTTEDGSGQQATRLLLRGGLDQPDIEFYTGARDSESMQMTIDGSSGFVGIGRTSPTYALDVLTTDKQALRVSSDSNNGTWLNLQNTSSGGLDWRIISSGASSGANSGRLTFRTGSGDPALTLDNAGLASVKALQITGGSDIAEPFHVHGETDIRPGMVVGLDKNNLGELRVSDSAYDRSVAGIISGANGINPGLTLTQTGTVADGEYPVALTGRVWCLVDADANGAVQVGDLLTTSNTPGHAMRVDQHDRAAGAIIGKAMSSLKDGRGMVLVLVSLQ
ncbi:MAG: hypothetical protein KDA54_15505 [Phycisphaerales bacterium]|nr:hypothetical protein [Phycisphaerales bacterium]